MVADAAHAHNIWVGVCGEMAGDIALVPLLLGLGMDELSVERLAGSAGQASGAESLASPNASNSCKKRLQLETPGEILDRCIAVAQRYYSELIG